MNIRRGRVVLVRLDPTEGSEIRKTRPAVVLSNNAACRADAVIQIVPLTSLPEHRPLRPYESRVEPGSSGLKRASRAVANQIRTVARGRIEGLLGSLTDSELGSVEHAVRIQFSLD